MKKPIGRVRKFEKAPSVRISTNIPLLMRQAIREREKMSNQSCASVVQNILLTSLRVEMELIRRDNEARPLPKLKAL